MNWKEFLKPGRKKIVIVFIFAFFNLFFLFYSFFEYSSTIIFNFLNIPALILKLPLYFIEFGMLAWFLDIIYWYLLSCLIIWVYDMVKKKQMKNKYYWIVGIVIVLIILIYPVIFDGGMRPATPDIPFEAVKQKYCGVMWRSPTGCQGTILNTIKINDYDSDKDGNFGTAETGNGWTWGTACPTNPTDAASGDNLASFLACYYGITSETDGLRACGCP